VRPITLMAVFAAIYALLVIDSSFPQQYKLPLKGNGWINRGLRGFESTFLLRTLRKNRLVRSTLVYRSENKEYIEK